MNKFMKAIDTVIYWIVGDRRDGIERRAPVKSNRKTTKRKYTRRKKK